MQGRLPANDGTGFFNGAWASLQQFRGRHQARFLRFALVGGASFLLNFVVLWYCTSVLGLYYQVSLVAAFIAVNLVAFGINKIWSFDERSGRPLSQLARFYVVMVGSLLTCMAMMHALVEWLGMNYLLANVVASGILLFSNFSLHTVWTFRTESNVER